MPSPEVEKKVRRWNTLLAAELGTAGGSFPVFQWCWSEDLLTTTLAKDAQGKPVVDYHCGCGVNVAVHSVEGCFLVAKARAVQALVAPQIVNKWALCRWVAPPTEERWKQIFGSLEGYHRNGTYVPMASNGQEIVLRDQVVPDERLTWLVIHTIKAAVPDKQIMDEMRAKQAQQEEIAVFGPKGEVISRPHQSSSWWARKHELQNAMTTFGQVPGEKGHVSYPSAQDSNLSKESVN